MVGTPVSLDARISKLLPALSARERAILVLKAENAGQELDDLRRPVPAEQRREYNTHMALLFVGRWQLDVFAQVLVSQVESIAFDLERMELLDRAAAMLEEDHPEYVAVERVRPWRKQTRGGTVTVPLFLRSLAEEVREDAFKEVCVRWQELKAMEIVAEEIAQHFDGEEPLPAETRTRLESCKETLTRLNAGLFNKPRRLPEPTPQLLEEVRGLVDRGLAALGLVEV